MRRLLLIFGLVLSVGLLSAQNVKNASNVNEKHRSNGVPAAPFPFDYQQPNGEVITIYIKGDGAVHWYQTEDGYTIMQDLKGTYYYTTSDKDGNLVITDLQVSSFKNRTSKEIEFLNSIQPEFRYSKEQIEKMKSGYLPYPKGAAKAGSFPTSGTNKLLLILQDFPDAAATYPRQNFDNMMNVTDYNGTGSFQQYYYANSYGQLTMVTTVVGWYTAANNHDYYCDACPGANPNLTWPEFVREAVDNAEAAGIDFSQFDNTGNGNVDGIMVIHEGDGAEMGDDTDIWSHSWSLSATGNQVTYDGVTIDDYTLNPETSGGGKMGTIGVLCHEFGHNLSLPDFYDTDYATGGQGFDLGDWDCMAGGSYNGGGATPAMHNAWSKISLGWMTATELNTACSYTLNPIYNNPEAFFYNTPTAGEYFLLENRQQTGFDVGIPGHGMLIYHVDENYSGWSSNDVNAVATHQAMDIEEADGTQDATDVPGDIFPGTSNNTSFTDATTPNSLSWASANTNKPLTSITENGGAVSFDFMGGSSSNPSGFATTTISSTQLDLSWALNGGGDPVMIAFNTVNTFGDPTPGQVYATSDVITGGGTVIYNAAGTSFNHTGLTPGTQYFYKAWSVATGEIYSCGISTSGKTCDILDIIETFDSPQSDWTPQSTTAFSWQKTSGTTPSGLTGPDTDHSGAGAYMFTEASTPAVSGDIAYLESPALDLAVSTQPTLKFFYHMYGANMGTLSVEAYNGGVWTQLWTISGQQHTSGAVAWTEQIIDLSAYRNQYEKIRFKGVRGADYDGDMAVDDISIYDNFTCTPPTTQASNFGDTPDFTSIDLTWTRGNGDNVLIVAREGTAVDANPVSNTAYVANAAFGSGDQIGTGNRVVFNGSGTSVTVTGLTEATTYHFAFYEYNNIDVCYMTPGLTGNSTTITTPPTIASVTPNNFFTDKGASLSITGTNFTTVTSVTIGGVSGTITPIDATSMTVDFPAGNYSNNTITVTNPGGSPTSTVTVNKRNIIPVGGGTDGHTTIQSALDGLVAWYGTTSFDAGQLPGSKIIDVYSGTYAEVVTPNTTLAPTATNRLIIQNSTGQSPVINATGNANGFYVGALNNVTISGSTVYGATNDNIYTEGDNNIIQYCKSYNSVGGSGIKLSAASTSNLKNNLVYGNYGYGLHLTSSDNVNVINNTIYDNGHITAPQAGVEIFNYDVESGDYTGWVTSGTAPNTWGPYDDAAFANSPTISFMLNAGDATLTYSSVDITGYDNLSISAWARSDASNMNNQDELFGEYSFDGSNWTQFFFIENDHAIYTQYSATGITPTSTTLHIRFRGFCDVAEYWHVDDIIVSGDETGAGENVGAGFYVQSGTGTSVENNIFVAKTGTGYVSMKTETGITVATAYNTYFKNGNTNIVDYSGTAYADFAAWPNEGTGDLESDPDFTDALGHINSAAGYYQGTEWPPIIAAGTWATGADSPALDAGNPADVYSTEPSGGSAINQGAYGNTVQASKAAAAPTGYTVSGAFTYANALSTGLDAQTLNLMDGAVQVATTVTDASGNYSFADIANGNYTVVPNISLAWGGVTATDISAYLQHIANITPLTGMQLSSGDVNASGALSTMDLTFIEQRLLTHRSDFPAGDWLYSDGTVSVLDANAVLNMQLIAMGDATASYFGGGKSLKNIAVQTKGYVKTDSETAFEVPISVTTDMLALSSITLQIPYDSERIEITEVRSAMNEQDMKYSVKDGVIRILYYTLEPSDLSAGEDLIYVSGKLMSGTESIKLADYVQGELADFDLNVFTSVVFTSPAIGPDDVTGLGDLADKVSVYPNPANDYISIVNAENSSIEIYNVFGSLVMSKKTYSKTEQIDISKLSGGTYFIRIDKDNEISMSKLTVVR